MNPSQRHGALREMKIIPILRITFSGRVRNGDGEPLFESPHICSRLIFEEFVVLTGKSRRCS